MVQDMFDPEMYLHTYEVQDLTHGSTRVCAGKYKDVPIVGPQQEMLSESAGTQHRDRQALYCVTIPGESPWVLDGFKKMEVSGSAMAGGSQRSGALKRHLEDDEEAMEEEGGPHPALPAAHANMEAPNGEEHKKSKTKMANASNGPKANTTALNLPLPSSPGRACIVKVYDMDSGDSVKLNECYEFVGIVSLDPTLAAFPSHNTEENGLLDPFVEFSQEERLAKSPPPSMVPRLHVIAQHRLDHANPTLPVTLPPSVDNLKQEAFQCRKELHAILSKVLLGDELAADYLICHLVSRIYLRKDVLNLGKLSVNLHNVPIQENYTKRLSTLLQLFLCKSHYIPLSINNLNNSNFIPKKDYNANRLISGQLQLSDNTHLFLDETQLSDGQLNPSGVKNLTALGTLITWQKVEYNFDFHNLDFNTDVPCLIMSEGRSILPSDIQIMLQPDGSVTDIKEIFSAIGPYLTMDLLERLRKYLTIVTRLGFDVSDEMQNAVQEDFVRERQSEPEMGKKVTAEELHLMLVLGRLYSLSFGDTTLSEDSWQKVKSMEAMRKERASKLPARPKIGGKSVVADGQEIAAN